MLLVAPLIPDGPGPFGHHVAGLLDRESGARLFMEEKIPFLNLSLLHLGADRVGQVGLRFLAPK